MGFHKVGRSIEEHAGKNRAKGNEKGKEYMVTLY